MHHCVLGPVIAGEYDALAAAGLDEGRPPGFHWAMRYLEGVNAAVAL